MMQYNTIEDAIVALTQKYGIEVFDKTTRFIALLSDYAPNHSAAQMDIRAFARTDGFILMADAIRSNDEYPALLSMICEKAVLAADESEKRKAIVSEVKNIAAAINNKYAKPADVSAIYAEGMNYYRRFPKEKNIPVAILLLEEAGDLGSSEALLYISSAYLKGKGVTQNTEKGMRYLQEAAKKGNSRASLDLAEYLWKGINIERNVSRAVSILRQVDDHHALFMLGEIFRENSEYDKAFEYYRQAAENNNVYAQYAVALAYATGQGTKRNIQEAKKWLRSAASLGHSDARKKLEELGEKWD